MLFINHATDTKAAKDYFTEHLSRSDYYMRDAQEVVGDWHGRGAELLNLSGQVDKESYFRLCENLNPETGEQLTPRVKSDRRVLYDFTFDAPKSVTLAYELGGDERIMSAFREAYTETMGEMEDAMRVRVRTKGAQEDRQTANMVWGEFVHRTTRPVDGVPDPQLHCHAVAFNATYDPVEERWKAGEFGDIVRDKGYYQAAFHSRFAKNLAGLGYGIERDGNSFRLAGIDESTCEEFSRRSEVIEAEAKRLGITDPAKKRELGRKTREAKPDEQLSMAELRELWLKRLNDGERTAIIGARTSHETQGMTADEAIDYSLSHSFERSSAVTKKKFLETALKHSLGKASVADIRKAAERPDILEKDKKGRRYVTTKDVLTEERDMIAFARDGRATRAKLGGLQTPALDPKLSDEQRNAALTILNSRDKVTGLQGKAGTGKTTMMQATIGAIEKTGTQVFVFAPSAEASHGVLAGEGFANAETVERLLIDKEMQKRMSGQVMWVDEAGLLSVKDMKRLFDVAKEQNARVILSGDSAQHNAVTRGDALRVLENSSAMQFARLTEIRRQTNATYRKAVEAIAQGDAAAKDGRTKLEHGMEMLDGMGAIIETKGDERYKQIAEDYADVITQRKANGELKTSLVVAPTHAEIRHVTAAIRVTLKAQGKLSTKEREYTILRSRNLTEAERGDSASYEAGEVVQFHQNAKGFKRGERVTVQNADTAGVHVRRADGSKALLPYAETKRTQVYRAEKLALAEGDKLRVTMNGYTRETRRGLLGAKGKDRLNNGALYQVAGFTKQGDIQLTNGFVVPKDYGGLTHGYVVTSHASQGKTVDVPLVALGSESFAAANREQLYVSLSRGREAVRLYTDDKAAMLDAVKDSSARLSATELMGQQVERKERKRKALTRFYGHAQRLYYKLRERIAAHDFIQAYKAQQQGRSLAHER
ncbi:MobF family relaxase [Paludibaculum fermentans]|uniref:MobF family relaxase n=1 Tax=Paludibaculum fermentans TaxID=1473598 RepID=UPI003EBB7923